MKCKCCDGEGWLQDSCDIVWTCSKCNGTGVVEPLTNEEWLRTATTEELAEWLAKQKCDGCNDEPYDDKHSTCKYCMTKKMEQIREWLQEKHN